MTGAETMTGTVAGLEGRPALEGTLLTGQRPRHPARFLTDAWLVLGIGLLLALSLVIVFDVSYFQAKETYGDPLYFFQKHLIAIAIGLGLGAVASRLPLAVYRKIAYPMLGAAVVLLLAVLIPGVGVERGGAQRWLLLGPLTFQPSEFAKLALVLYLAAATARKGDRIRELWVGVVPFCAVAGLLCGLTLLEPDFGNTVLLGGILVLMLFVAGARPSHLVMLGSVAVPFLAYQVATHPYRLKRVFAFLNPDQDPLGVNFQLHQSLIAIGSGGFAGVGIGASQQKLFYVPAPHTDFIFSMIVEELGLLGALGVVVVFAVIVLRGCRIARLHQDPFASLLAFGLAGLIALQAVLNLAVVLGCLPTKGLPLPFVSYGGSAMMLSLLEAGVLLALAREAG
jgi:cell division protein FtsW